VCTALIVDNAWNIPACDAEAVLSIPGLTTVLVGSYLYNPTYGSFLITGFNSVNGEVTIENTCLPGNADPGTVVPAGTEFIFGQVPTLTEYQTDWVPVLTFDGGTLVVGTLTVIDAEYFTIGTTLWWNLQIAFETTGTTSPVAYVSPPPILFDGDGLYGGSADMLNGDATVFDRTFWAAQQAPTVATPQLAFAAQTTVWVDGTDGVIRAQGFYKIA
jgi:hypothetical protein